MQTVLSITCQDWLAGLVPALLSGAQAELSGVIHSQMFIECLLYAEKTPKVLVPYCLWWTGERSCHSLCWSIAAPPLHQAQLAEHGALQEFSGKRRHLAWEGWVRHGGTGWGDQCSAFHFTEGGGFWREELSCPWPSSPSSKESSHHKQLNNCKCSFLFHFCSVYTQTYTCKCMYHTHMHHAHHTHHT